MLKSIHLNDYTDEFTAEEVAANLEAILNRQQLLTVVAARVAGFDRVAAGALLNGVEGHPDELARIVELYEQTTSFAIASEEIAAAIGERGIRAAWKRHKQANAGRSSDALMGIHLKIVDLAAKPIAPHRKEKAARQFEALVESKRPGGNALKHQGWFGRTGN
ncbi:hypothetical protein [Caballeronia sordidicola]|uniref:hypothetical protein n=1 Tax=Caballeronia sordidicola TaxID=196367 RepID=UPI0004D02566|nr:hypothetical protein [Caballeronia sordidicola]